MPVCSGETGFNLKPRWGENLRQARRPGAKIAR
ncbi:hypothetical protein EL78_5020 [Escherichia coli]|nr:hypothetical protein EL78_5020 [Escherichia coli]